MSSSQIVALIVIIICFVLVVAFNRSDEKRKKTVKTKALKESYPNANNNQRGRNDFIASTNSYAAGGWEPVRVGSAKAKGGLSVRDRQCPQCDHAIPYFELQCRECGGWLDNDVFRKLNDSEIAQIKSRGFSISTPSLITAQNGGFVALIANELKDYLRKTKTSSTSLLVSLYFLHAFASAIYASVQKQLGKEKLLRQSLYEKMIENYGSVASSLAPQLFECSLEEF